MVFPCVEEGSSTAGDRDRDQNEQELATRILNIQAKRFYVDVKENQRGRFIKLAEVAAGRRKNRIIFPMSTTAEFRDRLTEFQQASDQIGTSRSPFFSAVFFSQTIIGLFKFDWSIDWIDVECFSNHFFFINLIYYI